MKWNKVQPPLVSVTAPVCSTSHFIDAALNPILSRTCRTLEVPSVGDQSTDGIVDAGPRFATRAHRR